LFATANHAGTGEFEQIGAVLAGSTAPTEVHQVAAAGSTDTRMVLEEAGLPADQIEALFAAGVVQ